MENDIVSDPIDEAPPVHIVNNVYTPSPQDVEQHRVANHIPFRSWCPICIHGRGNVGDHNKHNNIVNFLFLPVTMRF